MGSAMATDRPFSSISTVFSLQTAKAAASIQPYSFAWQRPDIKAPCNHCLRGVEDELNAAAESRDWDSGCRSCSTVASLASADLFLVTSTTFSFSDLCQSQSRDHDLPPVRGRCLPGLHPRRSAHHDGRSIVVERFGGCFAFHLFSASEKGCCSACSIGNDESCFQ